MIRRKRNKAHRWGVRLLWAMVLLTALGAAAPWLLSRHWGWAQVWAGFTPAFIPVWLVLGWLGWKKLGSAAWIWPCLTGFTLCGLVFTHDFRLPSAQASVQADLTVLSMNVQYFNYELDMADSIGALVRRLQPDVVCLQEFRNRQMHPEYSMVEYFSRASGLTYGAFANLPTHMHGVAIFSKFPIEQIDTLFTLPDQTNAGMSAQIKSPHGLIYIASIHLSSFQVDRVVNNERLTLRQRIRYLYQRFQRISARQDQQVEVVLEKIRQSKQPAILCGDFNATPNTRILWPVARLYGDSFRAAGRGLGHTFPLPAGFGLRIDYQFFTSHWQALSHRVIRSRLSDHYPILVSYRLLSR